MEIRVTATQFAQGALTLRPAWRPGGVMAVRAAARARAIPLIVKLHVSKKRGCG